MIRLPVAGDDDSLKLIYHSHLKTVSLDADMIYIHESIVVLAVLVMVGFLLYGIIPDDWLM